jgi:hypothetical protein
MVFEKMRDALAAESVTATTAEALGVVDKNSTTIIGISDIRTPSSEVIRASDEAYL